MALAFDAGEDFGHDKPAGYPCRHLEGFSCSIHAGLAEAGYHGCVRFDCLGAGQRVTALFAGTWRDDPALTRPMMRAFRRMRDIQELRQMLVAAATLPLPAAQEGERRAWLSRLERAQNDAGALERAEIAEARHWLRGLAAHVPRRERRASR
ncbi:hypothetical protein [Celeribacter indicus]|nr:hypothetical protein [Celeribacter indicus]